MSGERERLTQWAYEPHATLGFSERQRQVQGLLSRDTELEEALRALYDEASDAWTDKDKSVSYAHRVRRSEVLYAASAVLAGVPATDTAAREAEQAFLAATVEVWQEIDRRSAEPGGYSGLAASTELRKREREAWERYKPFLVPATDTEGERHVYDLQAETFVGDEKGEK